MKKNLKAMATITVISWGWYYCASSDSYLSTFFGAVASILLGIILAKKMILEEENEELRKRIHPKMRVICKGRGYTR